MFGPLRCTALTVLYPSQGFIVDVISDLKKSPGDGRNVDDEAVDILNSGQYSNI